MGNGAEENDAAPIDAEILQSPIVALTAELAKTHGLTVSPALDDLVDYLVGLSCRDQDLAPGELGGQVADVSGLADWSARRAEGYKLAKAMRDDGACMLAALQRLHANMMRFNGEVVRHNPALLEAIFTVDTGGPDNLSSPPELAILETCFRSEHDDALEDHARDALDTEAVLPDGAGVPDYDICPVDLWDKVDSRLTQLAALPIRPALPRGPMPNYLLRKAIARVKAFWIEQDKSWTMSSLKHAESRKANRVDLLQGQCELFVASLLNMCDLRFTLNELTAAWAWVDANGARNAARGRSELSQQK